MMMTHRHSIFSWRMECQREKERQRERGDLNMHHYMCVECNITLHVQMMMMMMT